MHLTWIKHDHHGIDSFFLAIVSIAVSGFNHIKTWLEYCTLSKIQLVAYVDVAMATLLAPDFFNAEG